MEENINSIEGAPLETAPESRVAYFKRLIAAGQYQVDATRLADAMLSAEVVESHSVVH